MKQIWVPYWDWEDWINGMWGEAIPGQLEQAIAFTSDHVQYGQAMQDVIIAWPRTMLNSLTNTSINQRAFLGHCAVSYRLQIPESVTRQAWKELTDDQRISADHVAQQTIDEWKRKYESTYAPGSSDVTQMDCPTKRRQS